VFERTTTPAFAFASYAIEAAQVGAAPSCTTISSPAPEDVPAERLLGARETLGGVPRRRLREKAIRSITRQ